MDRRHFLKGFSIAAVGLVAAPSILASIPPTTILYADGVHDDAAALNAWIRGEPVYRAFGDRLSESMLVDGDFLLTEPLYFAADGPPLLITNCNFRMEAGSFLRFADDFGDRRVVISHCYFGGSGVTTGISWEIA